MMSIVVYGPFFTKSLFKFDYFVSFSEKFIWLCSASWIRKYPDGHDQKCMT